MRDSDLREGEKILCIVRHHGLFLFWPMVLSIVAMSLMIYSRFIADSTGWVMRYWYWPALPGAFGVLWLLKRLLVLRTDIWVVTDRRLVDEAGILTRTVKESPFEKIHNSSYTQSILGRIFNYGDLQVQTASTAGNSQISMVRDPSSVKSILMEAVDADLENRPTENAPAATS